MRFTSDLGVALHTALRKCCDSAPTSAAWSLINILEEPWTDLLKTIRAEFKDFKFDRKKPKTELSKTEQLSVRLKKACAHWSPYGYTGDTRHIAISLHCVFETFSDSDWYGFAEFLDGVIVKSTPKKKAKAATA